MKAVHQSRFFWGAKGAVNSELIDLRRFAVVAAAKPRAFSLFFHSFAN
jgi:hypothetical protein